MENFDDSLEPSSLNLSFSVVWVCQLNLLSHFLVGKLLFDDPLNRKRGSVQDNERKQPFYAIYFNKG